ncbi:BRE1 E3 ubiquitin ligase-domain-containing protein [Tuber borchii]|uniref:E3 ubiquitin protein ligase n=1 Tax=Tuber borchii TaxID=42251 RepID=A0A2T6ZYE0_TUBBO|nr:BRE1 E3 ubiquitin ligase-domain-containing protein [Tuber borchii]
MEDRKRPVPHEPSDDSLPPFKRPALNSASSSQAPQNSHQVPQSQEDVIHFQKEAIWRQMMEYKRERNMLESRVEELDKRSTYHDDHLRVIDAWWAQLLDEVRSLAGEPDSSYQNGASPEIPSSLLFNDIASFTDHLKEKRDHITSSLQALFSTIRSNSSKNKKVEEVEELRSRLSALLASEKARKVEIARLQKEKEDANSRLTEATIKYMTAEKKVDRLKSQTLAKIERQAMFQSNAGAENNKDGGNCDAQSAKDQEINAKVAEGNVADAEQARKEAQAIASKQKEELQQLQADNTRLSEQVTTFTIKFGRLSEEDISKCDAYKNLKVKLEDLATRFNHIEALNKELSERTEHFEAERTKYKEMILAEQHTVISEMQLQLSRTEQDLARVRAARDELIQDQTQRKTREDQKLGSIREVNELAETRASRIVSLEMEAERLRLELDKETLSTSQSFTEWGLEELRQKYEQLDKAYKVLTQELPALEQAFKKAHDQASRKVAGIQESEDKMRRLQAEKGKADQKYFSAMKNKETLSAENRALKNLNARSTDIITQLKDAEKKVRDLVVNLEKQIAEMKTVQQTLISRNREHQSRVAEQNNTIDSLKSQVAELSTYLKARDAAVSRESAGRREAEIEVEKLQVKLEDAQRCLENNRPKGSENSQLEALRVCSHKIVSRTLLSNHAAMSSVDNVQTREYPRDQENVPTAGEHSQ